jgi:hypothetical protein
LGQLGFIEFLKHPIGNINQSFWRRGKPEQVVCLQEYENKHPRLFLSDNGDTEIDVDKIPVLNVNLQNDGIGE